MDHSVESSTFEDFDDGPLKESKCYELDLSESGIMVNVDAIPSATSPTIETLSLVSELVDKQMSEENVSETLSSVSKSVDKQMSE
jgi:hypothetical protein